MTWQDNKHKQDDVESKRKAEKSPLWSITLDRCDAKVENVAGVAGKEGGGGADKAPGYLFLNHPPN